MKTKGGRIRDDDGRLDDASTEDIEFFLQLIDIVARLAKIVRETFY